MSRRSLVAVVAAVAILAMAVGWFAGQRISSPADIAANAEPPDASLITVPVEERELSTSVVLRGEVTFDDVAEISVSPNSEGETIVTRVPKETGDQLVEGDVVVEVAGRPLFVFLGELPVFRNLGPGVTGPDIRQLEAALDRLGVFTGTIDDNFDNDTEAAIAALYRAAGYTPVEATSDEIDQLESARQRVRDADTALRRAQEDSTPEGVPESTRIQANLAVRQAEEAVSDSAVQKAQMIAAAVAARDTSAAGVTAATAVLNSATARLQQAKNGNHPDTNAKPTAAELAELEAAVASAQFEVDQANQAYASAQASIATSQLAGDRGIADANAALAIAVASRTETFAQYESAGDSNAALTAAQAEVRAADEALAKLDAAIGGSFPSNELLFLPSLPREVQSVRVNPGDVPTGAVMSVSGSGLTILSSVAAVDRSLITDGAEGTMEDTNLGVSVRVKVAFVADTPGGPSTADDRYLVRLEPIDEVPEDAYNQNLRITLPFESTDGAVLAVPLAALSVGADGTSRVQVERTPGNTETITVATGLLARSLGLVEIEPVDGDLAAGDRVVVGRDGLTDTTEDNPEADPPAEDVPADEADQSDISEAG